MSKKLDAWWSLDAHPFGEWPMTIDVTEDDVQTIREVVIPIESLDGETKTLRFVSEQEVNELKERMEKLISILDNDCDIEASWDGVRGFWYIGLTHNGIKLRDASMKLQVDNDKMRELIRGWYPHMLNRVGKDALTQWGHMDVLKDIGVCDNRGDVID